LNKINITLSDEELMQRVLKSDTEALDFLYGRYAPLLYTLIKKITKDNVAAEETTVDVFGIIWRKAKYYSSGTNNSYTWIIHLAKNKAADVLRRRLNKENTPSYSFEYENDYLIPRLSPAAESLDLDKALISKDKIEKSLNSLTNAQQYIIYLAFYEGLTQQEISEKLKISLQTVRTKIRTSLTSLHEKFTGTTSLYTVTNEIVERIYPFVLGCLDYKETLDTINAFRSMENFPWRMLGEYQNLTAHLPVILEVEKPPLNLKDKITAHLYHLRSDEPAEYVTGEKSAATVENKNQPAVRNKDKFAPGKFEKSPAGREQKTGKEKFKGFEPVDSLLQNKKSARYSAAANKKSPDKNYTGLIIIIFIIFLIAASTAAYIFYKNKADSYEKQIEELSLLIESLEEENAGRPEIPGLGDLSDLKTADLQRTGVNSSSSGRILLSFRDKRGYLHVNFLPPLPANSAYQLWGNFFTAEDIESGRSGTMLSLGTFKVSSEPDYYPFRFPEVPDAVSAEFLVTEAPVYGLRTPGKTVYLKGRVE
jgi:RNA polymerase sigma-70 factor, ECF subfamily